MTPEDPPRGIDEGKNLQAAQGRHTMQPFLVVRIARPQRLNQPCATRCLGQQACGKLGEEGRRYGFAIFAPDAINLPRGQPGKRNTSTPGASEHEPKPTKHDLAGECLPNRPRSKFAQRLNAKFAYDRTPAASLVCVGSPTPACDEYRKWMGCRLCVSSTPCKVN